MDRAPGYGKEDGGMPLSAADKEFALSELSWPCLTEGEERLNINRKCKSFAKNDV